MRIPHCDKRNKIAPQTKTGISKWQEPVDQVQGSVYVGNVDEEGKGMSGFKFPPEPNLWLQLGKTSGHTV